jgi:hypothetical protein
MTPTPTFGRLVDDMVRLSLLCYFFFELIVKSLVLVFFLW